jgi:prepilin-type N-terminal cleavage/methylation domain-containing protein
VPRYRESRLRGVTLIEFMNVLTLGAILATLAMFAVWKYMHHVKVIEARDHVRTIGERAASYYAQSDSAQPTSAGAAARAMRHFPAGPPLPRGYVPDPKLVAGQAYRSAEADWKRSPWQDLGNFALSQPQHYAYAFTSEGVGVTARAHAVAVGDTDNDGAQAKFTLTIKADPQFNAIVEKDIIEENPEE